MSHWWIPNCRHNQDNPFRRTPSTQFHRRLQKNKDGLVQLIMLIVPALVV